MNLPGPPKFVQIEKKDPQSVNNFYQELLNVNIMQSLDTDLSKDPNLNYETLHRILNQAKQKHLPIRTVKFQKYKHKFSPWITSGILRSLKYRNTLYKKLKCTPQEYSIL